MQLALALAALASLALGAALDVGAGGQQRLSVDAGGQQRPRRLGVASTAGGVYINGLLRPTCVTYDDNEHVFISEKRGSIRRCDSWRCVQGTLILNIYATTSSFGDHGLTGLLWDRDAAGAAWLYAVFMKGRWGAGESCLDSGQFDGRLATQIDGCPIYGALSRWQVDDGGNVISPEQRLLDTELPLGANRACVQFTTHSTPSSIVKCVCARAAPAPRCAPAPSRPHT